MKVLLLHEFSGVHTELRDALRQHGVEADIATFGDYHKNFKSDIYLGSINSGIHGSISRASRQLALLTEYRKYDIIQSISPSPFNKLVSRVVEPFIIGNRSRAKYVYLSAGGDVFYRNHIGKLKYFPDKSTIDVTAPESLELRIAKYADALVSCAWEYHFALSEANLKSSFIPFPVNTSRITQREYAKTETITVYHPINRKLGNDFKGTSHIHQAFESLRKEFGNTVDFVERGGMSLKEYHEFTKAVDIVVDQTYSYTYGMSGLYALASGQVLMSGNELRTHDLCPYGESPVINILPDWRQIRSALRIVLNDHLSIQEIGKKGRKYAQEYHEAYDVAAQYITLYNNLLTGS